MTDETFQSGKWTGFYLYGNRRGGRHRQDMELTFAFGSIIRGSGNDDIGAFQIEGEFYPQSGEATWTKTYIDRHSVHHRGYRDAMKKAIWGIWEIGDGSKGGFKIWPVGQGADDGETETETKAQPTTAVAGKPALVGATVKSNDRFGKQKISP